MNNLKLIIFLIFCSSSAELAAQNPAPEWVMLFKNEVLAGEISLDGSRFAVLEKFNKGVSDKIILHFVSSKRREVFKTTVLTFGEVFHVNKIFISNDADKIAITGLTSPFDSPSKILPLTIMYDADGKEMWRTSSEMIGFIDNGRRVLLNNSKSKPCYKDEDEEIDYTCLRVADASSAELKELITFPGHLGSFGFVYIWDEIHVVIGSMEGAIYFKDIKDEIIWYIPGEGLIIKSVLDKDKDVLVVERGKNDSVYDKNGIELWKGDLVTDQTQSDEMPEVELVIKFGEPIFDKYQILFWKDNWRYQGMYKVQKDEINHLFHWDTFGQNFMRYSFIRYSEEKKRAIARTMDLKKVDYYNFEIKKDPATANEP